MLKLGTSQPSKSVCSNYSYKLSHWRNPVQTVSPFFKVTGIIDNTTHSNHHTIAVLTAPNPIIPELTSLHVIPLNVWTKLESKPLNRFLIMIGTTTNVNDSESADFMYNYELFYYEAAKLGRCIPKFLNSTYMYQNCSLQRKYEK